MKSSSKTVSAIERGSVPVGSISLIVSVFSIVHLELLDTITVKNCFTRVLLQLENRCTGSTQ